MKVISEFDANVERISVGDNGLFLETEPLPQYASDMEWQSISFPYNRNTPRSLNANALAHMKIHITVTIEED